MIDHLKVHPPTDLDSDRNYLTSLLKDECINQITHLQYLSKTFWKLGVVFGRDGSMETLTIYQRVHCKTEDIDYGTLALPDIVEAMIVSACHMSIGRDFADHVTRLCYPLFTGSHSSAATDVSLMQAKLFIKPSPSGSVVDSIESLQVVVAFLATNAFKHGRRDLLDSFESQWAPNFVQRIINNVLIENMPKKLTELTDCQRQIASAALRLESLALRRGLFSNERQNISRFVAHFKEENLLCVRTNEMDTVRNLLCNTKMKHGSHAAGDVDKLQSDIQPSIPVSDGTQKLVGMVHTRFRQAVELYQAGETEEVVKCIQLALEMLTMWRINITSCLDDITVDSTWHRIIVFNDCEYICQNLTTLGIECAKVTGSPFPDLVLLFRKIGNMHLNYDWQIFMQQLTEETDGYLKLLANDSVISHDLQLQASLIQKSLRMFINNWKNTLSRKIYLLELGSLCHAVLSALVPRISALQKDNTVNQKTFHMARYSLLRIRSEIEGALVFGNEQCCIDTHCKSWLSFVQIMEQQ